MCGGPCKASFTAGTNDHQLGSLKTREMESLTVLEARSLKSGIQQGQPPSEVSREESLQLSPGLQLHHSLSAPHPCHQYMPSLYDFIFVYLFLAVQRLRCCVGPPLVVVSEGYSLAAVHGLLIAVASFEAEHRL